MSSGSKVARQAGSTAAVHSSTSSPSPSPSSSSSLSSRHAGAIAGGVIGGVVFLVLVVLAVLLYLRARKRKRTPPSSEFMNSIREGAAPVLRLDSGAEYTPALPEKGSAYTHYPPVLGAQNYPPLQFPDETIGTPSELPLHPRRMSSPRQIDNAFIAQHHSSTSVGSRRELWGSESDRLSGELLPLRRSPMHTDSILHFAPRFSLDDSSTRRSYLSNSPSLYPSRCQEDMEGT